MALYQVLKAAELVAQSYWGHEGTDSSQKGEQIEIHTQHYRYISAKLAVLLLSLQRLYMVKGLRVQLQFTTPLYCQHVGLGFATAYPAGKDH